MRLVKKKELEMKHKQEEATRNRAIMTEASNRDVKFFKVLTPPVSFSSDSVVRPDILIHPSRH